MYVNFMINILNYNVINIIPLRKCIYFYYFTNFKFIGYEIFICTNLIQFLIFLLETYYK